MICICRCLGGQAGYTGENWKGFTVSGAFWFIKSEILNNISHARFARDSVFDPEAQTRWELTEKNFGIPFFLLELCVLPLGRRPDGPEAVPLCETFFLFFSTFSRVYGECGTFIRFRSSEHLGFEFVSCFDIRIFVWWATMRCPLLEHRL